MKTEWHSEFSLFSEQNKKGAIDFLLDKTDHAPAARWKRVKDPYARLEILTHLLASDDNCKRRTKCKDYIKGKEGLQQWYYAGDLQTPRGNFQQFLCRRLRWMAPLIGYEILHGAIAPPVPHPDLFPSGSFFLRIPFTLRKPYISKDDREFYVLDNPVKKEWVFKVPYVAPSQWKGALRAAMVRQLVDWWINLDEKSKERTSCFFKKVLSTMVRQLLGCCANSDVNSKTPERFACYRFRLFILFGSEKGEEPNAVKGLAEYLNRIGGSEAAEEFRNKVRRCFGFDPDKPIPHFRGALYFYPTFFDRIGLEVINPHDRKTGAGTQPIYFECVPAGTHGVFSLLYVPLYLQHINQDADCCQDSPIQAPQRAADSSPSTFLHPMVKQDLQFLARGIKAMLTQYGFGAKTSSGFGVADVEPDQIQVIPESYRGIFINEWERDE